MGNFIAFCGQKNQNKEQQPISVFFFNFVMLLK
jgi:hypothetical protein